MSEEQNVNQDAKKTTETSGSDKATADNQVEKKTDNFIPQARFDEINARLKKAELKNSEYEDADKKRELADLEKRGEFKSIIDKQNSELEELRANKAKQDAITKTRIEQKLLQLPEDKREKWATASEDLIDEALDMFNKGKGVRVSNANPIRQIEGVKDKSEVWTKMDQKDRQKNWSSIVSAFKNKN